MSRNGTNRGDHRSKLSASTTSRRGWLTALGAASTFSVTGCLGIGGSGGDAGIVDPMGRNVVTKSGFELLGRRIRQLGEEHAECRLVLLQEEGYQISHLAYAMLRTIEGILSIESTVSDPFAWLDVDEDSAMATIESVVEHYERWWDLE